MALLLGLLLSVSLVPQIEGPFTAFAAHQIAPARACTDPRDTTGGCVITTISVTITYPKGAAQQFTTPILPCYNMRVLVILPKNSGIPKGSRLSLTFSQGCQFILAVTGPGLQPISSWAHPISILPPSSLYRLEMSTRSGWRPVARDAVYSAGLYRFVRVR